MLEMITAGAKKAPVVVGNIASVSAGQQDVAVLTTTNNVYAIGTANFTGNGSPSGNWVKVADNVSQMATAYRSLFLMKKDGTFWFVGNNNYFPSTITTTTLTNVTSYFSSFLAGKTVKKIAMTFTSLAVLCTDGSLILSGTNANGGMGVGNTTAQKTPFVLTSITDVDDIGFDIGTSDTTYILRKNGAVVVAGYSDYGQAGNLSTNNTTFRQVQSSGILKIVPGVWGFFMFYRNTANGLGTIAMMGRQFSGSFGTGDSGNTNYTSPKTVLANIPASSEPKLFTGTFHARYWLDNLNPLYAGTIGSFVGCGTVFNGNYHYFFSAQPTSPFPWDSYAQTTSTYTAAFVVSKGKLYGAGSESSVLSGTTGNQPTFTLLNTDAVK